jgi:hypothetical protein
MGVVVAVHVSAHHAAEHREDEHHDGADVRVVWHGHAHSTTTPAHDHPVLVASTPGVWVRTAAHFSCALGHWQHTALTAAVGCRGLRLRPSGLAGVGPPVAPARLSILRI